jgi:hypothetical protein
VPTESDRLDAVQHPAACRDRLSVHRHGPITVSILNDLPSPAPIRVASHADTTAGWRPSVALLRIEVGGRLPPSSTAAIIAAGVRSVRSEKDRAKKHLYMAKFANRPSSP